MKNSGWFITVATVALIVFLYRTGVTPKLDDRTIIGVRG